MGQIDIDDGTTTLHQVMLPRQVLLSGPFYSHTLSYKETVTTVDEQGKTWLKVFDTVQQAVYPLQNISDDIWFTDTVSDVDLLRVVGTS